MFFLHGFTWDGSLWEPVADEMGAVRAVAVDLPGHGSTGWPRGASFLSVARGIAGLVPGKPTLVGYSMGARLALQAALLAPDAFRALVLVSGTAGIEDPDERSARAQQDAGLAFLLRTKGIEAFVDSWEQIPIFQAGERLSEAHRKLLRGVRLTQDPLSLARAVETLGQGQMPPLWDQLGGLRMPTLVVAGGEDPKYQALATRMAGCIPNSSLAVIPEAGHSVPLEAPKALAAAILEFLASQRPLTSFQSR